MIRYFKCAYCGKKNMDTSSFQRKRFCNQLCVNNFHRRKRGQCVPKDQRLYCQYNDGVECYDRSCKKCGWNPSVAKKRLEALV